jgi:hypothetical protein
VGVIQGDRAFVMLNLQTVMLNLQIVMLNLFQHLLLQAQDPETSSG